MIKVINLSAFSEAPRTQGRQNWFASRFEKNKNNVKENGQHNQRYEWYDGDSDIPFLRRYDNYDRFIIVWMDDDNIIIFINVKKNKTTTDASTSSSEVSKNISLRET